MGRAERVYQALGEIWGDLSCLGRLTEEVTVFFVFFKSSLEDMFIDFRARGRGAGRERQRKRERNMDQLPLVCA